MNSGFVIVSTTKTDMTINQMNSLLGQSRFMCYATVNEL